MKNVCGTKTHSKNKQFYQINIKSLTKKKKIMPKKASFINSYNYVPFTLESYTKVQVYVWM